jgi:hypothetical protein
LACVRSAGSSGILLHGGAENRHACGKGNDGGEVDSAVPDDEVMDETSAGAHKELQEEQK